MLSTVFKLSEFVIGAQLSISGDESKTYSFPILNMANCAPKKNGEYPQVVQISFERVEKTIEREVLSVMNGRKPIIGVVGFGEMGKRFSLEMAKKYKVLVYDTKPELMIELPSGITKLSSLSNLFAHSTIVVGCTSKDITESNAVQKVVQYGQTPQWLFSLSSGDKEFLSILKLIQTFTKGYGVIPKDIHADVAIINESDIRIVVKNGGNPINFRGAKAMHSVSHQGILLTRGLMGLSFLQAKELANAGITYADEIMICPYGQTELLYDHIRRNQDSELSKKFARQSEDEIKAEIFRFVIENSKGIFIEPSELTASSSTVPRMGR